MSEYLSISDRSRLMCLCLCLLGLFGFCGVHRIYAGKVVSGIIQFITVGFFGIWQVFDFIVILLGAFKDKQGRPIL